MTRLVGHSAGAQAMLRFAAQPGCVGDALVLLDTTQDYYSHAMPFFEPLVREITEGIATLTTPMLVAANPGGDVRVVRHARQRGAHLSHHAGA